MRQRLLLALGALVLMLTFLGRPPVSRTQEARVLQTAREMLGGDWIIPHLNGELRLEKPPLAYWLAAGAFKIGGVNEFAGRLPFALAGWLTLLVTCFAGRWLAGKRMGLVAAAILAGMWIFARHARLAETDILATLFVTSAIACIWRGRHALSGVMIGAAMMAKGLPAAFAVVFLFAFAAAERDWQLLWRWTRSGAPLIALAIGTPWFIYTAATVSADKFALEARKGLFGLQHAASFLQYFPQLLLATLPWTIAAIAGIVLALRRWKDDAHARGMILWFASIFIPLLLAGQRQFHYLLPAMPPLALLCAWFIEVAAPDRKLTRALLMGTRRPVLLGAIFAAGMMLIFQLVRPSLQPMTHRTLARQVRAIGSGPYCFYGENISLPLLFYLGERAAQAQTPQDLTQLAARVPSLIVIAQTKSGISPPPLPQGFIEVKQIDAAEQRFEIYRYVP
jgi:4-amino-4-deoxy-L-arabinose transferase-like glycosyltransferase